VTASAELSDANGSNHERNEANPDTGNEQALASVNVPSNLRI
jgi:hypothetical protein